MQDLILHKVRGGNSYYDSAYFAWQADGANVIANLERWKFASFIKNDDIVLDFGCGGGFLLAGLPCAQRYGIEINPSARAVAAQFMSVFANIDELPSSLLFDVILSHHALEHVDHPLAELAGLRSRLKPKGKMIFVVPSEIWPSQATFVSENISQHLYTWTPMSLGNLFTRAGFHVDRIELLAHRLLPRTRTMHKVLPDRWFHMCCRFWALATWTRQIRIIVSSSDAGRSPLNS